MVKFQELFEDIRKYTAKMVKKRLTTLPKGSFLGKDKLELKNGFVDIVVEIEIKDKIILNFQNSSKSCQANINAPLAVTYSAVYFFFRTLLGHDILPNSAFYDFFDIITPENSVVNAPKGAAVVAGNVETSQRIVDALLNAFSNAIDLPAQSHGTMNNVSFGNSNFTFYETIGGGAGAGNNVNGTNGVQVYMTNTKNTPVEVIESTYPLQCLEYRLRRGSGGNGQWIGGEGIRKRYRALERCIFSVISDRRRITPSGSMGGQDGKVGENIVKRGGKMVNIGGKAIVELEENDEVLIITPGGGGFGEAGKE
jgi:N-methylhydantoinase B/oxoprolinase/acetone carboxylase alpha subunit